MTASLQDLVDRLRESLRGNAEQPALEAELLVAHTLGVARQELFRHTREPASGDLEAAASALLLRRLAGEPIAYLTGTREFYGRAFAVGPGVLVPRPETEHLVEAVLDLGPRGLVADVGSGSGAVAVTLALEVAGLRVVAVDCSVAALDYVGRNADRLGVSRSVLRVAGDLLEGLRCARVLDGVVSNPPYVEARDFDRLPVDVRAFEPRGALVPHRGTPAEFRSRLIEAAWARLRPQGFLAIEVGAGQAGEALRQLREGGFEQVEIRSDLAGIGRVVSGRRVRA